MPPREALCPGRPVGDSGSSLPEVCTPWWARCWGCFHKLEKRDLLSRELPVHTLHPFPHRLSFLTGLETTAEHVQTFSSQPATYFSVGCAISRLREVAAFQSNPQSTVPFSGTLGAESWGHGRGGMVRDGAPEDSVAGTGITP